MTSFTSDPADVVSVTWYVASELVKDYDREHHEFEDSPEDGERMQSVINLMAGRVSELYPNANHIYIADGGYENQYASMASRCETASGAIRITADFFSELHLCYQSQFV